MLIRDPSRIQQQTAESSAHEVLKNKRHCFLRHMSPQEDVPKKKAKWLGMYGD